MIPLIGESKNVLTAGRVVGPIKDPALYHSGDKFERGEIGYAMGRSDLMEFYRCPHRWKNGYNGPDETKFTEWGSLIDCLYLTPEQFKDRYAVSPDSYPSKGMECPSCRSVTDSKSCRKCGVARQEVVTQKPWDKKSSYCVDWEAEQAGKTIVKNKMFQAAADAVRVLREDPELKAIMACSNKQVMVTASYEDEETGIVVPLKILVDILPHEDSEWGKSEIDLKTCTCAAMRPWRSTVFQHNLHVQSAFYMDVLAATTGRDMQDARHIIQESFAPYETVLRILSAEFLEIGRMKYQEALRKYCQCLKSNEWPTYEATRHINGWQLVEPQDSSDYLDRQNSY